jgi:hypothetical protein
VLATDGVARWFPRGSARSPGAKSTFHVPIRPSPPRSYARGDRRRAAGYARYSFRVAVGSEAPLGVSPSTPQTLSSPVLSSPHLSRGVAARTETKASGGRDPLPVRRPDPDRLRPRFPQLAMSASSERAAASLDASRSAMLSHRYDLLPLPPLSPVSHPFSLSLSL